MTNEKHDTELDKISKRILQIDRTVKKIEIELSNDMNIDKNYKLIEKLQLELKKLTSKIHTMMDETVVEQFLESVDQLLIDEGYLNENKERTNNTI